ncbi:hypothetical protein ACJX0J_020114, partial [Zea mays]
GHFFLGHALATFYIGMHFSHVIALVLNLQSLGVETMKHDKMTHIFYLGNIFDPTFFLEGAISNNSASFCNEEDIPLGDGPLDQDLSRQSHGGKLGLKEQEEC